MLRSENASSAAAFATPPMSPKQAGEPLAIEVDPQALPCRMPQYANEVPALDVADKIGAHPPRIHRHIRGDFEANAWRGSNPKSPEILGGGGAAPLADFLDADAAPQQLVDYFKRQGAKLSIGVLAQISRCGGHRYAHPSISSAAMTSRSASRQAVALLIAVSQKTPSTEIPGASVVPSSMWPSSCWMPWVHTVMDSPMWRSSPSNTR